jgi:hypothetical protein
MVLFIHIVCLVCQTICMFGLNLTTDHEAFDLYAKVAAAAVLIQVSLFVMQLIQDRVTLKQVLDWMAEP